MNKDFKEQGFKPGDNIICVSSSDNLCYEVGDEFVIDQNYLAISKRHEKLDGTFGKFKLVEPKQNEWHANDGTLVFSPDQKHEVMLSNGSIHVGKESHFLWGSHITQPHVVAYRIIDPVAKSFEDRVRITRTGGDQKKGFHVNSSLHHRTNATLSGQTVDGKPTGTWTLECDD